MTGPRDWDKEMADIDRIIASDRSRGPDAVPAPADAAAPVDRPAARAGQSGGRSAALPPPSGRGSTTRHVLGVWGRAILGAIGAIALPFWTYNRCGVLLGFYLLGTVGVMAAGIWTMHGAWRHRRAAAHVVGMLVFLAGLALALIEVLQHTGFVAHPVGWSC